MLDGLNIPPVLADVSSKPIRWYYVSSSVK